jgi:tRNA A-37 threonylcarbamoyl transferase component Bud32
MAQDAPLPQPTLPLNADFGPYHLLKLLAVGGMAEIYLARTKGVAGFEKILALKVIHRDFADDERFVQMLVDEAKLSVKLNHANIAQTFDLGRIANTYFISMEYVDGADYFKILKGVTDREREMSVEAAVFIAREICAGLDYAHNKADAQSTPLKIIHRDVSPQNILLSRHGEVKLVDFGIAKAANVSGKTKAGVIKGKLVYMSPEQAWGEDVDQRTDIYSAGVVLYESLTGRSLYVEQNPVKLLEAVRKAEIPAPSTVRHDVPPDLDELVLRAVRADREERYRTARDFANALSDYLRDHSPDYGAPQLGTLVQAIVDDRPLGPEAAFPARRDRVTGRVGAMDRADYAVHGHSIILAADELSGVASGGSAPRGRLLLLLEQGEPRSYEIGEQFIIGRSGDLRLADGRVSRRHARIVFHGGSYLLEDLNSSNGTYVNEQKVKEIRRLQPGDVVRIGPFRARFVLDLQPRETGELALSDLEEIKPEEISADGVARAVAAERPTASQPDHGLVTVHIGDETLVVPVQGTLVLDHALALGDLSLAARGSRLVCADDGFWLEPAEHRRPVLLNGRPVDRRAQLNSGDTITVGPIEMHFDIE